MQSANTRKRGVAGAILAPLRWIVEKALVLYYVGTDPKTPVWGKRALFGALLYIFSPLGIVLDFLPPVGEVDDLFALLIAIAAVAFSIKPIHKLQARETAARWFRRRPPPPAPIVAPPPSLPPPILKS